MPGMADTLTEADMWEALDILMSMSMMRSHNLGVTHLTLECGDAHLYYCLGRVRPHNGGVAVMVLPAIVRGRWCDGHRRDQGGGEHTTSPEHS